MHNLVPEIGSTGYTKEKLPSFQLPVIQQLLTLPGGRCVKKVSKIYSVTMKAKVDGVDSPVDSIVSLVSSDPESAMVAISKDGKKAVLKCQKVASGITLSGDALVMVKGKAKMLSATSEAFDIVADDNLEVVVGVDGQPILDPVTGKPKMAEAPSVSISVDQDSL
jgi:hypothetical protein